MPKRSGSKPPPKPNPQPQQTGGLFGLPDVKHPFQGVGGPTGAPAKTTRIPNLTEQVALARARKQRLQQSGLLTPAQRKAEEMAASVVATKTKFATPPPGGVLTPAQRQSEQRAVVANRPRLPHTPPKSARQAMQESQPGQGGLPGAVLEYLSGPAVGSNVASRVGRDVLAPAAAFGQRAVGVGSNLTLATLGVGSPDILTRPAFKSKTYRDLTTEAALARISKAGLKTPDVSIPVGAIDFGEGVAYAGGPRDRIPFSDLDGKAGWDLKPAFKRKALKIILTKQGYNAADVEGKGGSDLIRMMYNHKPGLLTSIAKGFAGDVVMGGSATVAGVGLAAEAAQGRGAQALGDLGSSLASVTPGFSNHPWQDTLEAHPLFGLTALHGGLKTLGGVGRLRPGAAPVRSVRLRGQEDLLGNPLFADLGRYNKNTTVAAGQKIKDVATTHGGRLGSYLSNKLAADAIDEMVIKNRDIAAAEHVPIQVAHRHAALKLSDPRKTELMAYVDAGGEPGLRNGIAHFEQEARNGNPRGAVMAEHYRKALENAPKTATEHAYIDTLRATAAHTSNWRQTEGLHGAIAQEYRKYETPIEFAASAGDPIALTAKAARNNLEDLYAKAKREGRPTAFKGKITEIGRDIKRHTKKAAAGEKRVADAQAALDAWKTKDKEIRSRRPTLQAEGIDLKRKGAAERGEIRIPAAAVKDGDVLSTHDSLRDASHAAKLAEADGHTVNVEKTARGYEVKVTKAAAPKATPRAKVTPEHKAALKKWRAEMTAHAAARPPKPTGVARAGGRTTAHRTEVNQQSARLERLTQTQRESLPIEEQIALAKADAEASTQAFVDSHNAAGGVEPAYVERTKIKSGIEHPSRLSGKNRFTPKMQREYRSTGHSITSGEFVYDPRSVLHANAQVQRLRQHIGSWRDIGAHPMAEHVTGSHDRANPTIVPKGKVAVNEQNYRSAAHSAPAWDNQPVSMHEVDREHSIRKKVADYWEANAKTAGEVIAPGEKVVLIPEAAHKRIIEWAKPVSKDGLMARYDRANAAYQRILIGIYPSTWMGNAPGSIPLAVASGALNPRNYAMARRMGKAPEDRVPVPQTTQGLGVGGSQLPRGDEGVVMRTVGKGRELSMMGEDYSARAAWLGQITPVIEGHLAITRRLFPLVEKILPDKYKGLAKKTAKSADELYAAMASGVWGDGSRISPELDQIRNRALDHVTEFMGVSGKPMSGLSRGAGRVLVFHRWLGHILKLTLVSLPLNHPRRAMLINAMSVYGNDYRQKHGVYPAWMTQFLPLMMQSQNGNPGVLSAGLGQLTPLASATNLASAGSQAFEGDPAKLAAGLTSPLIRPFADAALQLERNQMNRTSQKDYSVLNAFLAGIVKAAPGASKFQSGIGGGAGYEPGSNPLTGMRKRQYYKYVLSPSGKGFTKVKVPWEDRPGGRPVQGSLGRASRIIGLPLEWNPTGGHPLNVEQTNSRTFEHLDALARRKAAQKARQKHGG